MILFKSPSLTLARVNKKEFQNILNKIIEDLDLNLTDTLMSARDEQETKQKIVILKKFKKSLKTTPKENIEKQLERQGWLQGLVEDQLKSNQNSFEFRQGYENRNHKNELKNVTIRKKDFYL